MHTAQSTLRSGGGARAGSGERIFQRARVLVNKAVEARAQILNARDVPATGSSTKPSVPAHRPSPYIASSSRGHAGVEEDVNRGAPAYMTGGEGEEDSEEARLLGLSRELAETISRKYEAWKEVGGTGGEKAGTVDAADSNPLRYLSELDEDEWEECEPGEEGCEAFVVDTPEMGTSATKMSSMEKVEHEDEDEDLAEVRRRYAEQTALLHL